MRNLTLTSSFIAALSLTSFGQTDASLHSKISNKEKQLAEIQKELHELRSKLNAKIVAKHSVKQGETLHSIARTYDVSISRIMMWNKITDPTKVKVGENIVISELLSAPVSNTPSNEETSPSVRTADYIITSGDTFYSIARRHKMNLSELRALNPDVNIHLLSPGKKLKIPGDFSVASRHAKRPKNIAGEEGAKPQNGQSVPKPPVHAETLKGIDNPADQVPNKSGSKIPVNLPLPPIIENREISSTTRSIILTNVITFEAFASRHNTNTKHLNALNGWNLPKTTILAAGSEILVPN